VAGPEELVSEHQPNQSMAGPSSFILLSGQGLNGNLKYS